MDPSELDCDGDPAATIASDCFSSWISCRWDLQMADSFSYLDVMSAFSKLACFSCSLSLSSSASSSSLGAVLLPLLLPGGLILVVSNSATKALNASLGNAGLLLGCDLVTSSYPPSLSNLISKSLPGLS